MLVYETAEIASSQKSDATPVTQADLAAHHVLVEHLTDMLPGCCVVSEEDGDSWINRVSMGRFWLIDPLDGTKEFLARNGEFTVNIALIEDGCSVLGIVYAPSIDTMYWGGIGIGAFREDGAGSLPIRVSVDGMSEICRVVASKSHLNIETKHLIDQLGPVNLVQAGSSLKFCRVAEGNADIYPRLSPTCEWDTAAAQAILEAAGGVVVDMNGERLRYGKPNVLNPSFVAACNVSLIPK